MKINKLTLTYIAALATLGPLAAWFAHLAACLYDRGLPLCDHPNSAPIILSGTFAAILAWLALAVRLRLRRRILGGMYAKPVGVAGRRVMASMTAAGRFLWEGEAGGGPDAHPMEWPRGWGWRVALEDGSRVIVYADAMWEWLYDCYGLQQADPRRGATSRRSWPELSREQVLARNWLLDKSGMVSRNKDAANSIRRLNATPWPIMAALAERVPPGEV